MTKEINRRLARLEVGRGDPLAAELASLTDAELLERIRANNAALLALPDQHPALREIALE